MMSSIKLIFILISILTCFYFQTETIIYLNASFVNKLFGFLIIFPWAIVLCAKEKQTSVQLVRLPNATPLDKLQATDYQLYDNVHTIKTRKKFKDSWRKTTTTPDTTKSSTKKERLKRKDLDHEKSHYLKTSALKDLLNDSAMGTTKIELLKTKMSDSGEQETIVEHSGLASKLGKIKSTGDDRDTKTEKVSVMTKKSGIGAYVVKNRTSTLDTNSKTMDEISNLSKSNPDAMYPEMESTKTKQKSDTKINQDKNAKSISSTVSAVPVKARS